MTAARSIWLVSRRELIERARSRVFLVTTALTVLILLGVIVGPAVFGAGMQERDLGTVGAVPADLPTVLEQEAARLELEVRLREYDSVPAAEAALVAGDVDAVLVEGREVVWETDPELRFEAVLAARLAATETERRAAELGLDPEVSGRLLAPPDLSTRTLEPADPDRQARQFAAMIGMVLLFVAINMYGSFVLTGVVEEKSNRVVEVLLARLAPRHLLAGKILGIGTLGLAQVFLLVGVAVAALAFVPEGPIDMPRIGPALAAWLGLWFVLGFGFYATGYGAFGALASRMEDAQSGVGPLTLVIVGAYLFAFLVVMEDPAGLPAVVASYVPVTAPLVMPMRIASAVAPWWELVLAPLVTAAWIYGCVRLAGRIYTGAILRTGGKVKLRDAWNAST